MSTSLLRALLLNTNYFTVNKIIIKEFGLNEAAVLAILVETEAAHADENGEFFLLMSKMEQELNLGRKPIESAIKNLKRNGVISSRLAGQPAKALYTLNYQAIKDILDEHCPRMSKTDNQVRPDGTIKFAQNGQDINNIIEKEKTITPPPSPAGGKTEKVIDLSFVEESFIPIMEQWLAYKKQKKQKYTPIGLKQCYKKLQEYSHGNPMVAQEIIEQAMSSNYAGFFPLKQQGNGNSSSNPRSAIQYGNPLYAGIVAEMEKNGITGF